MLKSVVFPDPLGPIRPTSSPTCTLKLTLDNATSPPNFFVTSEQASMGGTSVSSAFWHHIRQRPGFACEVHGARGLRTKRHERVGRGNYLFSWTCPSSTRAGM